MNKLLVKSLSFCSVLGLIGQAHAVDTGEIKFSASLTPSACELSLQGDEGGVVNFGTFNIADYKQAQADVTPVFVVRKDLTVKTDCASAARVAVKLGFGTIHRTSVEAPDSLLSSVAVPFVDSQNSAGHLSITVIAGKISDGVDTVDSEIISSIDTMAWEAGGDLALVSNGGVDAYFSSDNGSKEPMAIHSQEFSLATALYLDLRDEVVNANEEIEIEKTVPLALVYL